MSKQMKTTATQDEVKPVLVPKLRFPEFREVEGWEMSQLDKVLLPVVREKPKPTEAYIGLGLRSHGKGTFLKPFEDPTKNSMNRLYEVKANDFIMNITFAWEGAVAIAQVCDEGALVSHRFPTYTFEKGKATSEFFRYIILDKQFIYSLGVISPGGAGRNRVLSKNDFLKLQVALPTSAEQQKIAACLTSIDDLITAQAQKVDALKTHKKGLMQQLFPCEGESVPRMRFPEFRGSGAWKKISLGKAATFYNGRAYKQEELFESGKYPVLRVGNLFTSNTWYYSDLELDDTKYCESNDLIYAWSASFGPRVWRGNKSIYHYHIWKVVENSGIDRQFLFITLENETENMKAKTTNGLGIMHITKGSIEGWEAFFPPMAEQKRVANCLINCDSIIALEVAKMDTLMAHKKGLMQQLFPAVEQVEA